jgi:hypothetical protein
MVTKTLDKCITSIFSPEEEEEKEEEEEGSIFFRYIGIHL